MKIAVTGIKGIPARYGGWETAVDELSTRLVEMGHEVTVYNRSSIVDYYKDRCYRGVKLVRLWCPRSKHFSTIIHAFLSTLHAIFTDVDVVHYYTAGTAIFAWIPRLFGKKTVCSVDGMDWQRSKWGAFAKAYLRVSELFAVAFANAIVTDAKVVEDYYLRHYRKPSYMIVYGAHIRDSKDPKWIERLGLKPRDYILFVGRITPENRVLELIRAFESVNTDKRLVIVGDDPYAHEYVAECKSTEDPRIVFAGYVYGEGYRELNCNSYLFVLPDEVGGTHPALVEAMAFGNCPLVNNTPANLEVIAEAGFSYDGTKSYRDLADKLQYLVDHPEIVDEYRVKARERIRQHYRWDMAAREHERLYVALSEARVSPPLPIRS